MSGDVNTAGSPAAGRPVVSSGTGDVRSPDSRPVFLVGAERSGTTLLRLMLDHHPQISFFSEFEFVTQRIGDDGAWPEITAFHEWLRTNRMFMFSGFTADRSLAFPDLIRGFLRQRQEKDGKPVVGATVHDRFHRLVRLWPRCRFIHIVRDPRDVARSCVAIGWAGNCWHGVSKWLGAEDTWERLTAGLAADCRYEVRYEDLVVNPEQVLRGLCNFLGVAYDDRMLSYAENSTYERTNPNLAFQWRRKATERDVRLVEARVGSRLTARGYEPSGHPPLHVGRWRRARLGMEDRWKRLRFRIRRFGPALCVSEMVSRRLRIRPWWNRCIVRMHHIQQAHVQ